jgi:hypothetical protein
MFWCYNHLQVEIYTSEINADNFNKIVSNYWNRVTRTLGGNHKTWSNTRNRMQTTKFKINNDKLFTPFSVYVFNEEWINITNIHILKHYATNQKVAGSILHEAIEFSLIDLILPAALWPRDLLSL